MLVGEPNTAKSAGWIRKIGQRFTKGNTIKMIVYFVRHGESVASTADVFQKDDDPLSKKGKEQVKILSERLKSFSIGNIFSSPLLRAKESAEIVSKKLAKPFEIWENLAETRNPKEIVGKPMADPEVRRIRKLIKENYYKGKWKYSDEETFEELRKRGKEVIESLSKKSQEGPVLCISHAGIIKMILSLMIFPDNLTAPMYWTFKYHLASEYAGVTTCKYSESRGWWVTTWNDTTHL